MQMIVPHQTKASTPGPLSLEPTEQGGEVSPRKYLGLEFFPLLLAIMFFHQHFHNTLQLTG